MPNMQKKNTTKLVAKSSAAVVDKKRAPRIITEQSIEKKLVKTVKALGGQAIKFTPQGIDGFPDRIILLPNKNAAFIEVKAPGKRLRPLQIHRMEQLEALGFKTFLLANPDDIDEILGEIQ